MAEGVILSVSDGIARMTFNRPEARNAMTSEILQAMIAFVRQIEHDPDVRCVLISGVGDHFMAGGDIKGMTKAFDLPRDERRASFEQEVVNGAPLFLTLERIPQPVVCSVRGFSAGVALTFVAGADLTIASDNANFLLAHVGIGLSPDGGCTYHVARAIGPKRAKQLAFLGDRISAEEALQFGLVNWVVPDAELEAETEKLLKRLANGPSISISQSKQLINRAHNVTLTDQLLAEGKSLGLCGQSDDVKEGVMSFIEKRKPQYKGR